MPRRPGPAEPAMDAQVAIRDAKRACAPAWQAALASGDWQALAEAHAMAETFAALAKQARRLTGRLDSIECGDHIAAPGHGRAA